MSRAWSKPVDRWLFSPLDARWLAVLRIGMAIAYPWFFLSAAAKLTKRTPDVLVVLFRDFIASGLHGPVVMACCGLLAFGVRARLMSSVLFVLLLPLTWGAPGNESRIILLLGLLFFALMPSGTVRFPWRPASASLSEAGPCWPLRLMQLLLATVYGINALAKTKPAYLRGETLMDMSVTYPNFLVDLSSGSWTFGILVIPVGVAAIASVLCEYLLALGLWSRRWKWAVAIIGILFHLVLTTIVQIFMLHLVSIFFYLVFLLPLIRKDRGPVRTALP